MFSKLNWQFKTTDRGTYAGSYFDKLTQLVDGYNVVIDGVNAQLNAGDDCIAMKAAITTMRNEVIALRDDARAIVLSDAMVQELFISMYANTSSVIRNATRQIEQHRKIATLEKNQQALINITNRG